MQDPFDLTDPAPPRQAPSRARPAPAATSAYLARLNDTQREAVESIDGPLLVLAGAGTGKTRVLTTRLAHILMQGRAQPWQLLAVTFTNKAAREMKERVAHLVGAPVEGWWVGTFHAIGARILRSHAEAVGLTPTFTILDADDQVRLVKQYLEVHEIDDKRYPARTVAGIIQRWKDRGLMPDKVSLGEGSDIAEGRMLALYRDYQARLAQVNAADFGDLLLLCLELFQRQPDVLAKYQRQFRYIMVDEYQDTNVAQYLW
ncbi:MAG: UvrD-helicase domain-containing protein, partial [Rhodospirillaceae bacterium]